MNLAIRVSKNYSFDTILAGAMLDPLAEHPAPYYFGWQAWQKREAMRRETRTRLVAVWQSLRTAGVPGSADVLVRKGTSRGSAGLYYRQAGVPARNSGSTDVLVRNIGNVEPMPSSAKATIHTARLILQILNVLEHRNPTAWAANQRQAYLSVLRWCVANYGPIPQNPAAVALAEKCYYRLGLFHRWEAVEKSRHILTSRQIEKGLRWNIRTPFLYMNGFEVIRSYLRGIRKDKTLAKGN